MADIRAARSVLREVMKDSPHTIKHIAEQVGCGYTSLVHRLKGERVGYQGLDVGLVFAILGVCGVSLSEYARRVEEADR